MTTKLKKPKLPETTPHQIISYISYDGELQRDYSKVGTYAQLRAVRKDPTVTLARGLLIAGIQAGSWSVETDDDVNDNVIEFMEHLLPLREDFLQHSIGYGKCDYGWMPFEKIFTIKNNKIELTQLKPLLHDITTILVTTTGQFNGYRQQTSGSYVKLDIPAEKVLHLAYDTEAGNYYGMPLLENIRSTSDNWDDCNSGAKRYDNKLAGSHWVIRYPPGTGEVDGTTTENGEIANLMLSALESSGSVAVPTTTASVLQELINAEVADLYAWHVELLSDQNPRQDSFNDRLRYLDSQKARGILVPERAILEGQFGTKAEADAHGEFLIQVMESIDRQTMRQFNSQVTDQLVYLNFGEELVGKVRLVTAPLIDSEIGFIREVYKQLNDPDVDMTAIRDQLKIPTKEGDSETVNNQPTGDIDNEQDREQDG